MLAGHWTGAEAQRALRPLFRPGTELREDWGDEPRSFDIANSERILREPSPAEWDLQRIAADVFRLQDAYEMMWHDADQLVGVRGEDAATFREVIQVLRTLKGKWLELWIELGRALERLEDLEYAEEKRL